MAGSRMRMSSLSLALLLLISGIAMTMSPMPAAGDSQGVCPDGWAQVEYTKLNTATVCIDILDQYDEPKTAWHIKIPTEFVRMWAEKYDQQPPADPWGDSDDPQPEYRLKQVAEWGVHQQSSSAAMVINGTFWPGEGGKEWRRLSFPVWYWSELANTGILPENGWQLNYRRCLAWNGSEAISTTWWYPLNDWSGVEWYGTLNCSVSDQTQFRIVGLNPAINLPACLGPICEPEGRNTKNFVGISEGSHDGDDELCFLVGGWYTADEAIDILADFGCTAALQLDGGNSTAMAYLHDPMNLWAWGVMGNSDGWDDPRYGLARPSPQIIYMQSLE